MRKIRSELKAEREQRDKDRFNRSIVRKAKELNKIMRDKNVKQVQHEENKYMVEFKNGQVFRFTFLPDSLFLDAKIIPILES